MAYNYINNQTCSWVKVTDANNYGGKTSAAAVTLDCCKDSKNTKTMTPQGEKWVKNANYLFFSDTCPVTAGDKLDGWRVTSVVISAQDANGEIVCWEAMVE